MANFAVPTTVKSNKKQLGQDILNRALRSHRHDKTFLFKGLVRFESRTDHILPTVCQHDPMESEDCLICKYEKELKLPNIPDMIYASNILRLLYNGELLLEFNSLDALKCVDAKHLPEVKVGTSEAWQRARSNLPPIPKAYDWTFTSDYGGTISDNIRVEECTDSIDLEVLKRPDPIEFIETIPLYEDEMDDNGSTEMTVRVRVMTTNFFIVCRFYLRVDGVLLRTIDSRFYSQLGWNYILREQTRREALQKDWTSEQKEHALDSSQLWQYLPVVEKRSHRIYYPTAV
ncbi:unnamed protein product [Bursaphelenchus okinawaensis]|uniref:TIP41-like protein n=1 Tax=Bursaphelenchus okinawaensis TaxID=465554 RepID=A0A811KM39_9BILA|nr:unnamed protein product [Bursaphelenchus okinawaensis]CAG9106157.1 unnamed protein product [Bursaphelenchus okinawaensis]